MHVSETRAVSPRDNAGEIKAPYRLKRIPLVMRVENWLLYRNSNECICDSCIAKKIDVRDVTKVTWATRKLARRESCFFIRWRGQCSNCGKFSLVIVGRRLTWA